MTDARTDPTALRTEAYADSGNLAARISIYAFRDDDVELIPWVVGQVGWPAPGPVLDVGCGPGRYLAELDGRRVASDLSFGMVAEAVAAAGVPGVQADVARLPVSSGAVGRVLAPHMLYHAADPAAAVAELRRVLTDVGDLVVVLNAADHLHELRVATESAAGADLGWERLTAEEAVPLLSAHFSSVDVQHREARLLVTDPAAVGAYVASSESLHADATARPWAEVVADVTDWAAAEIARTGHCEIHMHSAALVCRP
jgi:SAM-dependent methyltransferase